MPTYFDLKIADGVSSFPSIYNTGIIKSNNNNYSKDVQPIAIKTIKGRDNKPYHNITLDRINNHCEVGESSNILSTRISHYPFLKRCWSQEGEKSNDDNLGAIWAKIKINYA